MIALVFAVIAYCRAFLIGRHHLGMEVAALRHQLAKGSALDIPRVSYDPARTRGVHGSMLQGI